MVINDLGQNQGRQFLGNNAPPHTHITYTERGNHGSFGKGEKERAFSQMTRFIGRKGNVKSGQ